MSTSTASTPTAPAVTPPAEAGDADQFRACPVDREYTVEDRPDGSVVVHNVPVFGENERKSFAGDVKYDELWLKRAVKIDGELRKGDYRAPMHFGHHTFAGGSVDPAGHYELTSVRKCKLHGKTLHVAFADLVFKDRARFQRYRSEYPYRSVEISHERPDQINSLALLAAEAPFFQFPIGNLKFGTEVTADAAPKAHYFGWQAEGSEQFAAKPPAQASKPPKFGEDDDGVDDADEAPAGISDGADGQSGAAQGQPPAGGPPADAGTNPNDAVMAALNTLQSLLMTVVKHLVDKDKDRDGPTAPAAEPDGDETDPDDGDDESMSDKTKNQPVVAASADVAAMQGEIVALRAEMARLAKEREQEQQFAALKAELQAFGLPNLDEELRKHVQDGTAAAWAAGVKRVAPAKRPAEAPGNEPVEDPALVDYLKKHPKADGQLVRNLAAFYAEAPEDSIIRKYPLDRFLAVQLEMGA